MAELKSTPDSGVAFRIVKVIKLMTDYECHPLWHVGPDEFGDIDPATLPVSDERRLELAHWDKDYDQTLDMDDPPSSGFESEALEAEFKAQGHRLAERLRDELGTDFIVIEHI